MPTLIFKNYAAFQKRRDKDTNGVSEKFAQLHPDSLKGETNVGCWNCLDCTSCTSSRDCRQCFACQACRSCRGCYLCDECGRCVLCANLRHGLDRKEAAGSNGMLGLQVPIIPDIHQRIYKLARPKKALYMGDWHKCGTTHCRGGWVTHAAGAAGADLELAVGPAVAAYLIYAKSSRIAVSGRAFYVNEKSALASMKRMAKLEAQNGKA